MSSFEENVVNELVGLRLAVYGRDNGYSDWLADVLHIDEDEQRPGETKESYEARVQRVKDRTARLSANKRDVQLNVAKQTVDANRGPIKQN